MNNENIDLQELVITDYKKRRGMQYLLEIDGEEYDLVDKKTFDNSEYSIDSRLSVDELKLLMNESTYNRAKNRAFYFVSVRDYSCKEIKEKLYGVASGEVINAIIEELCEMQYLDDGRYARNRAKMLFEIKKFPARRVVQELRSKGVSFEISNDVVAEYEQENDVESEQLRAYQLICRKHKNKMCDFEGRRKVTASLGRYGFSYESVRAAMSLWDENSDEEE